MNKEPWVFIAGLALVGLGIYFTVTTWRPEKQFEPPPIKGSRGVGPVGPSLTFLFASEDDACEFRAGGRDPFQPKRDTEPLPLADLTKPPLPPITRVAPGPMPGLGHSRLRPLEEAVPEGTINLTGGPGEEGGGEEEEEDESGRRRY